jgi:hypothetical protein
VGVLFIVPRCVGLVGASILFRAISADSLVGVLFVDTHMQLFGGSVDFIGGRHAEVKSVT